MCIYIYIYIYMCVCIIIIISSLPHGRSLASMSSIYLYLQPFFSCLHNCLPSNRQSYPSLASLLVSSLSLFPLSSALTNCSLAQHVLSSSFSLHYCLHQTSLFLDRGQHFYIRLLILP